MTKVCITRPDFRHLVPKDNQHLYEVGLAGKGFHMTTNTDPVLGCPRFRQRVNDLTGMLIYAWGLHEHSGEDFIQCYLLHTHG